MNFKQVSSLTYTAKGLPVSLKDLTW